MATFEFCIDALRGIVPGALNSGKNNLTAAKSSIELANSCTVDGVDTSGLTNAIAWIDRTIGFVDQWGGWIQEKISALEKLDSDNNQLASLLGEDVDINNIDLDKIIEQAEKLLGLIGEDIDLQKYLEQLKNGSIGNSKVDKEWATSSIFELLEGKYDEAILGLLGGENAEEYSEKYKDFLEIPLFNQMDYTDTPYGNGTIKSSGCGITTLSQILRKMGIFQTLGEDGKPKISIDPVSLAKYYKGSPTSGTPTWMIKKILDDAGVKYESLTGGQAWDVKWPQKINGTYDNTNFLDNRIVQEVKNGNPVILLVTKNFTQSGHYIAITGITDDGKFIVYDPNGLNWDNANLEQGYKEGFDLKRISESGVQDYIVIHKKETQEANKNQNTTQVPNLDFSQFLGGNNTEKFEETKPTEEIKDIEEMEPIKKPENINKTENSQKGEISENGKITIDGKEYDTKLTASGGVAIGPTGMKETWYDMNMSGVVNKMKKEYGIDLGQPWINFDKDSPAYGCKMYGDYIMVAADTVEGGGNVKRGDIVETSLGLGIVVDHEGEASTERENNTGVIRVDIATTWNKGDTSDLELYTAGPKNVKHLSPEEIKELQDKYYGSSDSDSN